jgi:hypothetical protein
MMIFAPATIAELREALHAQYGSALKNPQYMVQDVLTDLEKIRNVVEGGEKCRPLLIHPMDEDPDVGVMRNNLYQNVPIAETIVDEQSHWTYGFPPRRSLAILGTKDDDPAVVDLNKAFSDSYEANGVDNLYRNEMIPAVFRDRWAFVKTWDQEVTKMTRVTRLLREECFCICHPDDASTYVGVVEIRKRGDVYSAWATTTNEIAEMDAEWKMVSRRKNKLGRVPYTLFGSCAEDVPHQLVDAYFDQIVAINRRSWYLGGLRLQAQAIFALIGNLMNKEQVGADGRKRTRIGLSSMLMIAQGGDFKAVNPNYAAKELRDSEQSMLREAFDLAKVSPDVADSSSSTAETATAVRLRKSRVFADRNRNLGMFRAQEKQQVTDWLAVSSATGRIKVDPATVEIRVIFPDDESVLPADTNAQRTTAMLEVEKDLRTREDYVREFVKRNAPPNQVEAYMAELEEAIKEDQAQQQSIFGGVAGAVANAGGPSRQPTADRVYGKNTPPGAAKPS